MESLYRNREKMALAKQYDIVGSAHLYTLCATVAIAVVCLLTDSTV